VTPSYEYSGPININTNDAFEQSNWPGTGTREDPYVIEGLRFIGFTTAITITSTTSYFIIRNCSFKGEFTGQHGIWFTSVRNGYIEDCEFDSFYLAAVRLHTSSSCSVALSTFYGCERGIHLSSSSFSNITANTVFSNNEGIYLDSSENCSIRSNEVFGNQLSGISCRSLSENNSIYGNRIGWNPAWDVTGSFGQNAFDDAGNNTWDNNVNQGNSWDDWDMSENYTISGTFGGIDRYPSQLVDDNAPIISHPFDMSMIENSEGHFINWSIRDQHPHSVQFIQTDHSMTSRQWNGTNVLFNLDHLSVGVWNITIIAYDAAGNNVTDSVLVAVVYEWIGGLGTEQVVMASAISVIFMVVVLMIYKVLR
jgi:parallel beta-helix repeat protein